MQVDYSKNYSASTSDIIGFEMKKIGEGFIVYYHPASIENANKVLSILEQSNSDLYNKYLGWKGNKILVFLTTDIDEYVKIAEFPGGKENVQVGDGSAPNGRIYLYKPFEENIPGKSAGMIVHEGVHAVLYQFLSSDIIYLPGFLNEGLAHYTEYVFKSGEEFLPLEQIYHSDLLVSGVKTDNPKLMSIDELGTRCDNYISDETLNFLCRGQGTFIVWSITENYGESTFGRFLVNLKQTKKWKDSLSNITGKSIPKLGDEVREQLKILIEK